MTQTVTHGPELELRARYSAVRPGYHQDKRHWNTVDLDGPIDDELRELVEHSLRAGRQSSDTSPAGSLSGG
jgi:predicted DNA-binding protein (MmcQ/YjbR family)